MRSPAAYLLYAHKKVNLQQRTVKKGRNLPHLEESHEDVSELPGPALGVLDDEAALANGDGAVQERLHGTPQDEVGAVGLASSIL